MYMCANFAHPTDTHPAQACVDVAHWEIYHIHLCICANGDTRQVQGQGYEERCKVTQTVHRTQRTAITYTHHYKCPKDLILVYPEGSCTSSLGEVSHSGELLFVYVLQEGHSHLLRCEGLHDDFALTTAVDLQIAQNNKITPKTHRYPIYPSPTVDPLQEKTELRRSEW